MTKAPKNPFKAFTATEFGGVGWRRAKTLDDAIAKARAEKDPTAKIRIARRWVETTSGEVVWTA